jgi:hypothetical protein
VSSLWRYEPLGSEAFPIGQGPFRARGLAYRDALRYVDERLPGSRPAFLEALGKNDELASYYDQIFLVAGDYDVSPLVRLFVVAASLERKAPAAFIQERARWSGETDLTGVWKRSLQGPTPGDVAKRLAFAFERYFPPCTGTILAGEPERCEGEIRGLPACMNGVYAYATVGFYLGALEATGARDVRVQLDRPRADGVLAGVPTERLRFVARWVAPAT